MAHIYIIRSSILGEPGLWCLHTPSLFHGTGVFVDRFMLLGEDTAARYPSFVFAESCIDTLSTRLMLRIPETHDFV